MVELENSNPSSIVSKRLAPHSQASQTDPKIEKPMHKAKCKEILSYKISDEVKVKRIANAVVAAAVRSGKDSAYARAAIIEAEGMMLRGSQPVVDIEALLSEGLSVKEAMKRIFRAYRRALSRKAGPLKKAPNAFRHADQPITGGTTCRG